MQVRVGGTVVELLLGGTAGLDSLCQLDLLLVAQQRHAAELGEVQVEQVARSTHRWL